MPLYKNSREYDQIANRPREYTVWSRIVWGALIIGDLAIVAYLMFKFVY